MKKILLTLAVLILPICYANADSFLTAEHQNFDSMIAQSDYSSKYTIKYGERQREYVLYKDYAYLKHEQDMDAKRELRVPDYRNIPIGGMIGLYLCGDEILEASPRYKTYVVMNSSGKEILRKSGRNATPNYTIQGDYTLWHCVDIIDLRKPVSFPLKIRILNNYTGTYTDATISKK